MIIINKMKTIVFSLALATMTLTTNNLNAQYFDGSRGLFGMGKSSTDDENNDNRDGGMEWFGGGMTPTNPETGDVALGSGLALLVAAGAGYAALKRKEDKQ